MPFPFVKRLNIQFLLGLCTGICLTAFVQIYSRTHPYALRKMSVSGNVNIINRRLQVPGTAARDEDTTHQLMELAGNVQQQQFEDTGHHHDDISVAKKLYREIRVACWIMTSPSNLESKTIHVKNTWAKRCNLVLFMSSVHNSSFPTIGLNVSEGRSHLTAKTMKAFEYLYNHHLDDADWFFKADDDTYTIVENLRYFLSNENPQEPVYFGHRFKPYVQQGYPSGGGGYVLSQEALRRFGTEGVNNHTVCAPDTGAEDMQMGRCLQNLGVKLKSSLDALQRTRFHCFNPDTMLKGKFPKWYENYDFEGKSGGIGNISDYAISFHYVPPDKMYTLEFFIYHLRPYGIIHWPQELNVKS